MPIPQSFQPLPPIDPERDISQNHYWSYHGLDRLLQCKQPVTASRDEDLFIAVHQICELAFHQAILDLERTLEAIAAALQDSGDPIISDTTEACYFFRRVLDLYAIANRAMPTLGTMRAFVEFRSSIGPTSGFQSVQFRRLEIMSGVGEPYWRGGTRDRAGNLHPAELEFERRYGDRVGEWFERYRDYNLVYFFEQLCDRAAGETRTERIEALKRHGFAKPLLEQLADYDEQKRRFHQGHLGLAVQQLSKVGVDTGTGGTNYREYLSKYNREVAPLFTGL
ncbi:tryptophan 2,3-dioxygenase family protein [Synechococcus sp. PCC 7336]|uniref:tryptophan 2,3-dioxygenase family protein n=1 Tax=Synechococcus sp. PCC 7336 TaxID=195250 RepID=UPI000349B11E|nr:tryptophan 2,3-dioxygenase family protein [Synechococcus sp. PCC 7336]